MMVRWRHRVAVCLCDDLLVRWHGGLLGAMALWHDGVLVWWYEGMAVWRLDGVMASGYVCMLGALA